MLLLHLLSSGVVLLKVYLPGIQRGFQVLHGFGVGFILRLLRYGFERFGYPLSCCGSIPGFRLVFTC